MLFFPTPGPQVGIADRRSVEFFIGDATDTVLISICDSNEQPARLKTTFHDVLRLHFDDVDSADDLMADEVVMTEDHAQCIARFVHKYTTMPKILVHCHAGISRSAATAAAIMKYLGGNDALIFNHKAFDPNDLVYNLVLKALQE